MPMEQAQVFFRKKQGRYESIDVRLSDPMATASGHAPDRHGFGKPVYMYDWKAQRAQYFNALNLERNMMRLVMMVLVAITAMNIISGVLMLVKNKTRDIAILRTIGASRGAMMRVFIMIGGALGLAGALVGMVLGVVTVINIPNIEWALGQVWRDHFRPGHLWTRRPAGAAVGGGSFRLGGLGCCRLGAGHALAGLARGRYRPGRSAEVRVMAGCPRSHRYPAQLPVRREDAGRFARG